MASLDDSSSSSVDAFPNADVSTLPAPLQSIACRAPSLARTIQFCWRFGERWALDRCAIVAAAMAFFGLLSLFPLMLAAIAVIGKVLADRPEAIAQFVSFAGQFFPGASGQILQERVQGEIVSIAASPHGVTLGLFSLASLLWSGRAYFDTLAAVLNSIWPNAQPRWWWQHQIALWSTFVGAGLLYVLSLAATFLISVAHAVADRLPDLFINRQPVLWDMASIVTSWLLTLCMFWMIYRFLPNAAPGCRGRTALVSAFVATFALELAKYGFTRYLPDAARYGAVYGGVASVVLMMMWLYISSSIILLGAEVAAAYAEVQAVASGEAKPTLSKAGDSESALGHATVERVKHG